MTSSWLPSSDGVAPSGRLGQQASCRSIAGEGYEAWAHLWWQIYYGGQYEVCTRHTSCIWVCRLDAQEKRLIKWLFCLCVCLCPWCTLIHTHKHTQTQPLVILTESFRLLGWNHVSLKLKTSLTQGTSPSSSSSYTSTSSSFVAGKQQYLSSDVMTPTGSCCLDRDLIFLPGHTISLLLTLSTETYTFTITYSGFISKCRSRCRASNVSVHYLIDTRSRPCFQDIIMFSPMDSSCLALCTWSMIESPCASMNHCIPFTNVLFFLLNL